MLSQLESALERMRATNKPIDATPMNIVQTLISTQRGWLIRQAMKGAAALGTIAITWLTAKGVVLDHPEAITAAIGTLTLGVTEILLSKLASKIAAKS